MSESDDVLIFPEHCPNHGAKATRYWLEPAGEGYELRYLVTVQYRCKQQCLQSLSAAREPKEVRDFAGRGIPKTEPPRRIYPGEE